MDRKVVFTGKIQPGISKDQHCLDIINKINELKLKKEMKQLLFLATMKIIPEDKKNQDILYHLESFRRKGKIFPDFSDSEYIQNVINEIKSLDEFYFFKYLNRTIEFVAVNNIEFLFEI